MAMVNMAVVVDVVVIYCCSQSSSCCTAAFDDSEEKVVSQMICWVEIEKKLMDVELMEERMIQLMDLHMPRSEMMKKSTKRRGLHLQRVQYFSTA